MINKLRFSIYVGLFPLGLTCASAIGLVALFNPDMVPALRGRTLDRTVVVPAYMTACSEDQQCGAVETACSACCNNQPIHTEFIRTFYDTIYSPACQTYAGAVCDCAPVPTTPQCIEGLCQLTPVDQPAP